MPWKSGRRRRDSRGMTTSPLHPLPRTATTRLAGWLLAVAPLGFATLVAASAVTFASNDIGLFDDIDRATMDRISVNWAIYTVTLVIAHGLGGVGATLAGVSAFRASGPGRAPALAAAILSAVGVALAVVGTVLYAVAAGFEDGRLGDSPAFATGGVIWVWLPVVLGLGVLLLCLTLLLRGLSRVGAIVIGGLAAVYVLGSVVTGGFLPPFVISLLWLPLGVVWLRALRRG